ncbi:hypothetical protein [Methanocella sp. MCL-LM]
MSLATFRGTAHTAFWYAGIAIGIIILLLAIIDIFQRPDTSGH